MFNYGVAELQNNGTTVFFKTTSQREYKLRGTTESRNHGLFLRLRVNETFLGQRSTDFSFSVKRRKAKDERQIPLVVCLNSFVR